MASNHDFQPFACVFAIANGRKLTAHAFANLRD